MSTYQRVWAAIAFVAIVTAIVGFFAVASRAKDASEMPFATFMVSALVAGVTLTWARHVDNERKTAAMDQRARHEHLAELLNRAERAADTEHEVDALRAVRDWIVQ